MKKLKIILPVLLIAIIAAAAAVVVFYGDKLAITGKSRVSMGMSKSMDTLLSVEGLEDEPEIFESMSKNPYEIESSMSVNGKIEDLDELIGKDAAKSVEKIIKEVANAKLTTKLGVDRKNETAVVKVGVEAKDIIGSISGEAVVTGDGIAVRSEELNPEFIKVSKDDDEELEEAFDMVKTLFEMDYTAMRLTSAEKKHFKDTYGKIFSNYVVDEKMTSEKVELDGKKYTKETLTLEDADVRALLKEYFTTLKNDKETKDMIENKLKAFYGKTLSEKLLEDLDLDEAWNSLDEVIDSIDEIEGVKIEFISYCTFTDVYRTETVITIDNEALTIRETYNGDDADLAILFAGTEVAKGKVVTTKDSKKVSLTFDAAGEEATVEMEYGKKKVALTVKAAGLSCTIDMDIKEYTDKAYAQDSTIEFKLDDFEGVSGNLKVTASEKISVVKKLDVPDTSDAISYKDSAKLQKYGEKCQKSLEKYIEKVQKSDTVKEIMNLVSSVNSLKTSPYSTISPYGDIDFDLDDEDEDDLDFSLDLDDEDEDEDDLDFSLDLDDEDEDEDEDDFEDLYNTTKKQVEDNKKLVEENTKKYKNEDINKIVEENQKKLDEILNN